MTKVYVLESGISRGSEATKRFFKNVELFTAQKLENGSVFFKDINSFNTLETSEATIDQKTKNYGVVNTRNSDIHLWKVEDPQYRGTGKWKVLCSATYKGYKYYVVDGPMNPCCYIDLAGSYWEGKYHEVPCDVHGGITYDPTDGYELSYIKGDIIGWDYGHFDDFQMFSNGSHIGRVKYTTYELIRDCQKAIDDLERVEDEETLSYCCD